MLSIFAFRDGVRARDTLMLRSRHAEIAQKEKKGLRQETQPEAIQVKLKQ